MTSPCLEEQAIDASIVHSHGGSDSAAIGPHTHQRLNIHALDFSEDLLQVAGEGLQQRWVSCFSPT